jgi:hypothetical protein
MKLIDVTRQFSTDDKCLDCIEQMRWPNGVCCVHCGVLNVSKITREKKGKNQRTRIYQCLVLRSIAPKDLFPVRAPVLCGSQFLQQRLPFAEPRPLPSLHVPRQRPLLRQQFLRPLARLFAPVRRLQKTRIVVQRLRSR